MNKKRDRLQVIFDILHVIQDKNGEAKPTHVLYKSNLSHQMMEEYMKELIEKEFVIEIQKKRGRAYALGKRGFEYLQQYRRIKEFITSFDLD